MRIVVDTNILISALISPGNIPDQLYQLWLDKKFGLVTSQWQIAELRRVSRYDGVKKYLKTHEVGHLVNSLREKALILEDLPTVSYSPDPDDNPILAAGIAGEVHFIVSGDKSDILELQVVQGIPIVTARAFVELL